MYLLFAIFVFLFIMQVWVGIYASVNKNNLKKRYSFYLGDQIELNKILEKYKEGKPRLQILASDEINDVCIAEANSLIINKKAIYAKDLYSNFYLLFQLQLTKPGAKDIRQIYAYQSISFFLQFISIIIFFVIPSLGILATALAYLALVGNMLISFYGITSYNKVLDQAIELSKKYLSLDKVEEARLEKLASEIKYEVLAYPLEIPWRLSRFWKFN